MFYRLATNRKECNSVFRKFKKRRKFYKIIMDFCGKSMMSVGLSEGAVKDKRLLMQNEPYDSFTKSNESR